MKRWRIADEGVDTVIQLSSRAAIVRRAVWAVAAAAVVFAYPIAFAAPWVAGVVIVEFAVWLAARPFRQGLEPTPFRRWMALLAATAAVAFACAGQTLFWNMPGEAMRLLATAFIFMLLIHAQIFMSRSMATLVAGSLLPAVTFLVEVIGFSGYHGFALVATVACAAAGMGYAFVGGMINQRTAQALEAAKREADEANAAKSAFLAMMSHELRTPMNGVLGMAHALKLSGLDARQDGQVDVMIASGEGLMSILGDILDISKIEAGKMEIEAVPTDLGALCQTTTMLWADAASAKGVVLSCHIDPNTPSHVLCDPTRLRQVLANLVSNALKFTERGQVSITLASLPGAAEGRARLQLSVSDTGIGLSSTQLTKLFQPFTQVEASISRRFGGTGLGLSICKRLVELMQGEIAADSRDGQGSTFRVSLDLPLCTAPETAMADVEPDDISGLRLLVVDDNQTNRLVASAILSAVGAVVETANDGADALEALRREHFDVVLMDIHMPKLDGVGALECIRAGGAGRSDMPIIALTADAMDEEVVRLVALGFDGAQAKPIQPVQLIAAIAAAAQRRISPGAKPERATA